MSTPAAPMAAASTDRSGGALALAFLIILVAGQTITAGILWPLISTISEYYGKPTSAVLWTSIIMGIAGLVATAIFSGLGRIYGNKRFIVISGVLLVVGCVLSAIATQHSSTGFWLFMIGRGLQGLGGGMMPLCLGVIGVHWSGQKLRRAMAMTVGAIGIGGFVGYYICGIVVNEGVEWHWLMWITAAICFMGLVGTFPLVRETPKHTGVTIDYVGALGVWIWSPLILIPLSMANQWGWGSVKVLCMLIPGFAGLAAWLWYEARIEQPLLNVRVLVMPGVWQGAVVYSGMVIVSVVRVTVMSYIIMMPGDKLAMFPGGDYGLGKSILWTSIVLAFGSISVMLFAQTTQPLQRRLGSKWVMFAGAASGLILMPLALTHGNLLWLCVANFIAGIYSAYAGCTMSVAAEAVPKELAGVATGAIAVTFKLSGAIATAIIGYIMSSRELPIGKPGVHIPAEAPIEWVLWGGAGFSALAMLCVLTIKTFKKRDELEGVKDLH